MKLDWFFLDNMFFTRSSGDASVTLKLRTAPTSIFLQASWAMKTLRVCCPKTADLYGTL